MYLVHEHLQGKGFRVVVQIDGGYAVLRESRLHFGSKVDILLIFAPNDPIVGRLITGKSNCR